MSHPLRGKGFTNRDVKSCFEDKAGVGQGRRAMRHTEGNDVTNAGPVIKGTENDAESVEQN